MLRSLERARDILSAKDGIFLLFAIVSLVPLFVVGTTRIESISLDILAAGFGAVFLYVAIPWAVRRLGGGQISLTTALPASRLPRKLFYAWPYGVQYTGDAELAQLSKFANTAFGNTAGDTMAAEVVRQVVRSEAAIGLRLTTASGRNIGFFDAYHFRAEVLRKWIDGGIRESELTAADFEPIAPAPKKGARKLELAIGGIVVFGSASDENLAHVFTDLAQDYLESTLAGYDQITLYATIFSDWGGDLANDHGFQPCKHRSARLLPVAQKYDVVAKSIRPARSALKEVYTRAGEHCVYVVQMGKLP